MATLEEYAKKMDVHGMMITAIITALTLVVGLFWNDAIRSAIETLIPEQQKTSAKFMAAILVTIIVVVVAFILIKTEELSKKHGKELLRQRKKLEIRIKQQRDLIEKQRKRMERILKKKQ